MYPFYVLIAVLLTAIAVTDISNQNRGLAYSMVKSGLLRLPSKAKSAFNWNRTVDFMKAKFGAIVVAGSGKIGGHVASRNRAGAYFRTKVTPINPSSAYQQTVRNRLAGLASGWRGLTAPQRDTWNAAVQDYAKTDVFGDIQNPSGFNLYVRLNANLLAIGEAALTSAPAAEAVTAFTSFTLAAAEGAGTLTLTFAAAIAATHKVLVFATPALSAGKTFVKSEYRLVEVIDNADVSPYDGSAAYEAKFGAIGAAGQKIFVQLVQVNIATGQKGIPIEASAIIAA